MAVRARRRFAPVPVVDIGPDAGERHDVRRALASLPESQRAALILVDWLDMDTEEAARALGIKPGSVRVRLHRARSMLRDALGGDVVSDTREDLLRPGVEGFEPAPDAFERVLARRDRKRRNERILAGAVAIAIALAGVVAFVGALRSEPTPADRDDIAPPNNRPVFQRTATIGGGLTVMSPSDWYLVDYWGQWNADAVSLETNAIPLLELTNFDPGLSTPVCTAEPGGQTRLPANGVAIFVTAGGSERTSPTSAAATSQPPRPGRSARRPIPA